jgi:hypothetical protein
MGRILGNADLSKIYTKQAFPLGATYEEDGRLYRFIKYNAGDGGAAATIGHLIVGLDTGGSYAFWEGTNDPDSATIKAVLQRAFGFAQAALTDGSYGWVQISGPNRQVILTDNNVAQGELLMAHATTSGAVDTHDAAAKTVVGIALEADGTTAATQLDVGQVDIRLATSE